MKNLVSLLYLILICTHSYSQKEITKNGQKINKIDKQNKKQGSWFLFDEYGDLALSCYYKNDTIVKPMIFYKNNDSIFIRYPKVEKEEIFLIKSSNKWVIGSITTEKTDSTKIEILGLYKKLSKEDFEIVADSLVSNSPAILKEIDHWANKEIAPIYLFDPKELGNFQYKLFSEINIVFNKKIYVEIELNLSGIIEKINIPKMKSNLSQYEIEELSFLYSKMQRWQPFFSKNKTEKYTVVLNTSAQIK